MTLSKETTREKLTFKPEELPEMLGIGKNSVYALLRSGRIRSIKLGRKIIVPRDAVTEFLAGSR